MKQPRPIVECSECPDYYDGGMISYPSPQCTHDSFCNTRYPPIVIDEGKLFPSFCPLEDAPEQAAPQTQSVAGDCSFMIIEEPKEQKRSLPSVEITRHVLEVLEDEREALMKEPKP